VVVHVYNLSYLGGSGRRITSSRPAQAKVSKTLSQKTNRKQKDRRFGRGEGREGGRDRGGEGRQEGRRVLILPSFLKGSFAGYKILV
jgi:hypothetical protein